MNATERRLTYRVIELVINLLFTILYAITRSDPRIPDLGSRWIELDRDLSDWSRDE